MNTPIWLYPVSEKTGHYFEGGNWKSQDTSPEEFAEMIRRGGHDNVWGISTNFRRVHQNDTVVVYASKTHKRPPLIVGAGTVSREPFISRAGRFSIGIQWDLATCKLLAENPIDASWLARELQDQKASVTAIPQKYWSKIKKMMPVSHKGAVPKTKQQIIGKLKAKVRKLSVTARQYEAIVRHDAKLIVPLRKRLKSLGWKELSGSAGGQRADYLAEAPDGTRYLLVEAKTIASHDGRNEIRYAIGQLLEYDHFIVHRAHGTQKPVDRLLLLERKPAHDLCEFVESLGFFIAWYDAGCLDAGPSTGKGIGNIL
jgi:hypothetical protein